MVTIAAYYYPGWHNKDQDSEWDIVKNAKPYFKGHYQPRIPTLGYLDDSKISTLKMQSELATSQGIDAFIFDWYWKKGEIYRKESIQAFNKVDTDMKFALMWTWKIPRKHFPLTQSDVLNDAYRWVDTSKTDFLNLLDYCSKNYFNKKNYWLVDGKPYFVMYSVEGFLHKLGSKNLAEMLIAGDNFLKKKGYDGLYVVGAIIDSVNKISNNKLSYKQLGFDALTGYNFLPDFSAKKELLQDYAVLSDRTESEWNLIKSLSNLPYIPSISLGWDSTPRGVRLDNISYDMSFPWAPIVVNVTPNNFAKYLKKGLKFINDTEQDTIHICSWNEWSEGAYLEPDKKYGLKFLEKIRKLKDIYKIK